MTEQNPERAAYPHVSPGQHEVIEKYGDLIFNTGGNDPRDLLNRMQKPGTDARPNRLASTNIVVFTLAVGVQAQVFLLASLETRGMLSSPEGGDRG